MCNGCYGWRTPPSREPYSRVLAAMPADQCGSMTVSHSACEPMAAPHALVGAVADGHPCAAASKRPSTIPPRPCHVATPGNGHNAHLHGQNIAVPQCRSAATPAPPAAVVRQRIDCTISARPARCPQGPSAAVDPCECHIGDPCSGGRAHCGSHPITATPRTLTAHQPPIPVPPLIELRVRRDD
ncbi:hypothetical protein P154DRAFT_533113 [Amniculicola lignicola CBS 123094]|uniref:Uncharacterized protein n=1 Tax=Amniculicola lignicola CBS 123094 TaxID=1392246 RepID=A0A6A5WKU6_9PLEO|nr:hypothetical protein P154DRAFT_533113 [Amniculicola lignicola CBS 123094]